MSKKPIFLMILDGFGFRKEESFNSVLHSHMSNYFNLYKTFPHTKINASGPKVGLPQGQIGSSEVGHLTLGAGRIMKQLIVRISEDMQNGEFEKNNKLNEGLDYVINSQGNIHLMGLLGPGGVHSYEEHLFKFLEFYDKNMDKISGKVFIHCFLDGRDTPQKSALEYLEKLENKISTLKNSSKFTIGTITGRFYAMDRDLRWKRTKKAYDLMVNRIGATFHTPSEIIKQSYEKDITDEFVEPALLDTYERIKDKDLCVFYNFRSDRPKQIVKSFIVNPENFGHFETKDLDIKFQTLTQYDEKFDIDVLYPTIFPQNTLGEVLGKNNLSQLRISESEKFPHVTYFFNGLDYGLNPNEDQIRIPSPKVATYDLQPEMSSRLVTDTVLEKLKEKNYDFFLLNFANPDMVGHTGNFEAACSALDAVDKCIKEIYEEVKKQNGILMITADHGNCEKMRDDNGNPHTKHTYNKVPFILCSDKFELNQDFEELSLANVAPTILDILNIEKPTQMSSESLITKKK